MKTTRHSIVEEDCNKDGHEWVPAFYCQHCGLQASEALEAFKEKITKLNKKKLHKQKRSAATEK
jgi:hypothetical protein